MDIEWVDGFEIRDEFNSLEEGSAEMIIVREK